jgi:cytochrome c
MKSNSRRGLFRVLLTASIPVLGLVFIYFFMDMGTGGPKVGPETLYQTHCGNCHGKNGEGLRELYPPLAESDYLKTHQSNLPCMIRYGMEGPILVNGKPYDQPMPGIPTLSTGEITAIVNFINTSWGNAEKEVKFGWVEERLKYCAGEKSINPAPAMADSLDDQ